MIITFKQLHKIPGHFDLIILLQSGISIVPNLLLIQLQLEWTLRLLDKLLSKQGLVGVTLSMITNPKFTQMTSTLTSISRVLPQCIVALCFPKCQFQPRVSLCSWPSPMQCHQKGLSSNYPGHFIQFILITLPFLSLLILFSLVCLSAFLDLQLSWSSFLWLTHLSTPCSLLCPPLKPLALLEALTHSP